MEPTGLMQRAQQRAPAQEAMPEEAGEFKRPDPATFTPPEHKDAVERVVAAGMKFMYAPEMREELQAEIARETPVPQKMAEAVTGLLLTLDKQTEGGIPVPALFPAGLDLLGEAAEVLTTAGQAVTQADYNEAAQMMFVLMARKMGAKDEEIMGAAEQALGGGQAPAGQAGPVPGQPPAGPPGMPPGMPPQGAQ